MNPMAKDDYNKDTNKDYENIYISLRNSWILHSNTRIKNKCILTIKKVCCKSIGEMNCLVKNSEFHGPINSLSKKSFFSLIKEVTTFNFYKQRCF